MHTTASDGLQTAEEMAVAARERGLEYIAITDHSASHGFGNDVSPAELEARIDEIHALNERLRGDRGPDRDGEQTSSPTARSTTPTSCSSASTG
jgi:DNA polymerase III alpha subunit (gram-positive type)